MVARSVVVCCALLAACAAAAAAADADVVAEATTGLAQLAREGNAEGVLAALDAGAKLDERADDGFTPLMAATLRGHDQVVRILLDRGADPRVRDHDGYEAIHGAAFQGRPEAAMMLIQRAGVEPDTDAPDGYTPLHRTTWGKRAGHVVAAQVLLKAGADPNAVHPPTGNTPLHEAAARNSVPCAEMLIKHGAHIRTQNKAGTTPLQFARAAKHAEMVQLLELSERMAAKHGEL